MRTGRTSRVGPGAAGFTLIEILAVLLIVGILATILITQLAGAEDAARVNNTRRRLAEVSVAIDAYTNEHGNAPASSFTAEQGVPNDGENVGVEALVVALWSKGFEAAELGDLADLLVNTDGDSSPTRLTDFETRALLEIPDDWGNPIAYFQRRDYGAKPRTYVTLDPATGEELRSEPVAWKNPTTGRFYRVNTYQLVSAGPDGLFGTEDDIPNFDTD